MNINYFKDKEIENSDMHIIESAIASGESWIHGMDRDLLIGAYARKYLSIEEAENIISDFLEQYASDQQ